MCKEEVVICHLGEAASREMCREEVVICHLGETALEECVGRGL